jgi:hypothetical protein
MKWEEGRQGNGYYKFKLFQFLSFDCYLLKFPEGSQVPNHKDKVDNKKHYRFNVIIKNAKQGGKICAEKWIYRCKRFHLFRPDKNWHLMTKVEKGTKYILSFGAAI